MRFRFIAAILVVAVATLSLSATPGLLPNGSPAGVGSSALEDKPHATRRLLGPDAEKFAKQLLETDHQFRQAQERSAERIKGKGWKRVGVVSVEFSARAKSDIPAGHKIVASIRDAFIQPVSAAQDAESKEGYIVTTAYDDGNDDNAEANLYVHLYDGQDTFVSIDMQAAFPDDGTPWYRIWAGGDVGDRDHPTREASFEDDGVVMPRVLRAKFQPQGGGCRCVMFRRGGSAGCMLDEALMTAWEVCSAALAMCGRRSWPASWACIETWGYRACGMSFGVGMIRSVSQWVRNCRNEGLM